MPTTKEKPNTKRKRKGLERSPRGKSVKDSIGDLGLADVMEGLITGLADITPEQFEGLTDDDRILVASARLMGTPVGPQETPRVTDARGEAATKIIDAALGVIQEELKQEMFRIPMLNETNTPPKKEGRKT